MANVEDVGIASQRNDGERQDVNGKGYNADISMESEQRHRFIIRDYAASIRQTDIKKSWPFTMETVNPKLLPPLEINKEKWNCNDCLRDLRRFFEMPVDEEYMNDDGYDNLGIADVQMNQTQEMVDHSRTFEYMNDDGGDNLGMHSLISIADMQKNQKQDMVYHSREIEDTQNLQLQSGEATALVRYEMDKQEKVDEVRSGHESETNVMKEKETMSSIVKTHKWGGKKRRPKIRSIDDIIASEGRPTERNNISRIKVKYRNIGVQTMDVQNFSTPSLPEVMKAVIPIGQSTSHLALVPREESQLALLPREESQLALVPSEEALQNNYLNTEYGHSGISVPSSAVPGNAGATLETPVLRTNPPLLDIGKRRKRGLASTDGINGPPTSQSAKVAEGSSLPRDIGKRRKRGLASTDGINGPPTSQSAKVAEGSSLPRDIGKRRKRGLASTDGINGPPTSQSAKVAKGSSSTKRLRLDKQHSRDQCSALDIYLENGHQCLQSSSVLGTNPKQRIRKKKEKAKNLDLNKELDESALCCRKDCDAQLCTLNRNPADIIMDD